MYVVVPPSKGTASFRLDLVLLAKRHGLAPSVGRATDGEGHTSHVIAAEGRGIRLWSENAYLRGTEAPALCGKFDESHPDPGQYVFYMRPKWPFPDAAGAREINSELKREIAALGYEVRADQVLCSSFSKPDEGGGLDTSN